MPSIKLSASTLSSSTSACTSPQASPSEHDAVAIAIVDGADQHSDLPRARPVSLKSPSVVQLACCAPTLRCASAPSPTTSMKSITSFVPHRQAARGRHLAAHLDVARRAATQRPSPTHSNPATNTIAIMHTILRKRAARAATTSSFSKPHTSPRNSAICGFCPPGSGSRSATPAAMTVAAPTHPSVPPFTL